MESIAGGALIAAALSAIAPDPSDPPTLREHAERGVRALFKRDRVQLLAVAEMLLERERLDDAEALRILRAN